MKQKLVDFFNLLFGLRKFIAWLAVFIVGVIFRITSQIDGGQFVDLMKSTFLAFVAANGAEHLLTTVKEYIGKKGIPTSVIPVPSVPNDNLVPTDNS
jgi:hypothetical protein